MLKQTMIQQRKVLKTTRNHMINSLGMDKNSDGVREINSRIKMLDKFIGQDRYILNEAGLNKRIDEMAEKITKETKEKLENMGLDIKIKM